MRVYLRIVRALAIDANRRGWVSRIAEAIEMHPKDVRKWVETHVPEIVKPGHLAQLVERTPDKGEVTSSSLVMSTKF